MSLPSRDQLLQYVKKITIQTLETKRITPIYVRWVDSFMYCSEYFDELGKIKYKYVYDEKFPHIKELEIFYSLKENAVLVNQYVVKIVQRDLVYHTSVVRSPSLAYTIIREEQLNDSSLFSNIFLLTKFPTSESVYVDIKTLRAIFDISYDNAITIMYKSNISQHICELGDVRVAKDVSLCNPDEIIGKNLYYFMFYE